MPSPWSVFKSALRVVPALRYALAVAGIIGLLAIIKVWQIDPQYGVYGVIIMLGLMVGILVFANLAQAAPGIFAGPGLAMLWAFTILIIASAALLFTSAFFRWPLSLTGKPDHTSNTSPTSAPYTITAGDRKVFYIEGLIEHVRGAWNSLNEHSSPHARMEVYGPMLSHLRDLEDVPDSDLGEGGLTIKRNYLCFGQVVIADLEQSSERKLKAAAKARDGCAAAQAYLRQLMENTNTDNSHVAAKKYIVSSESEEWIKYLYASTLCMSATIYNDKRQKGEVIDLIKSLPPPYLEKLDPSNGTLVTPCMKGIGL